MLQLAGAGHTLIAERDPSSDVYHVNLPALDGGDDISFDVTELDRADAASGITSNDVDGKLDVSPTRKPSGKWKEK